LTSGIKDGGFVADGLHYPPGLVFRHLFEKTGKGIEKIIEMGVGIKQNTMSGKGRGDVGEAELDVAAFTGCHRIGNLVFVEIDKGRRA